MAATEVVAWIQKASECCGTHRCEEAIGLLEAVVQVEPANHVIHYQLGICYTGACRRHSLVDLEGAQFHLNRALALLASDAEPADRATILGALGNTYAASRHMPPKGRLRAAIQCHQQAGAIFQAQGMLEDWAREEFNLGNALSELPEDGSDKWGQAIHHYENALQVRTKGRSPQAYAGILQNLGIAYRERATGDRANNTRQSILCYRRALQVYRPWSHPRGYAVVQNNLGNSFVSLAAVDQPNAVRHIQRALRHYDRALTLYSSEDMQGEYAMALFNRGQALVHLAENALSPEAHLRQAASCFREAAGYFNFFSNAELFGKSREWVAKTEKYLSTLPTSVTAP